jgi:hypothetical protein
MQQIVDSTAADVESAKNEVGRKNIKKHNQANAHPS